MSIFRANSHKFHEWQKIKIIGNDSKKEFSNYFKIIISLASSCHTIKNPSVLQNIGFFLHIFIFFSTKDYTMHCFRGSLLPLMSAWLRMGRLQRLLLFIQQPQVKIQRGFCRVWTTGFRSALFLHRGRSGNVML